MELEVRVEFAEYEAGRHHSRIVDEKMKGQPFGDEAAAEAPNAHKIVHLNRKIGAESQFVTVPTEHARRVLFSAIRGALSIGPRPLHPTALGHHFVANLLCRRGRLFCAAARENNRRAHLRELHRRVVPNAAVRASDDGHLPAKVRPLLEVSAVPSACNIVG